MMTLRLHVFSISCYFFFCVFALSFLVTTIVSQPYRRPDQIETLLAFKDEFDSCNNSVARSWIRDAIAFDGVVFDSETGVVTKLDLRGGCLDDTLGGNSSLFKFHHLRYLDLSYNNIDSSSFLAELGRLTNLDSLDLSNNDLVGKVPSSISNLSRLTYLDLSSNNLNSSIPLLYNLTKLSSLDLSNNRLKGKVPEWLWNLPSLTALSLSHNSLDSFQGQIPESIGLLKSLIALDLSNNRFMGYIPSSLGKLTNLESLDLSRNQLSGRIPQELVTLTFLEYLYFLDLSNNSLQGKVPEWLWNLPSLTALSLSHNSLDSFDGSPESLHSSSVLVYLFLNSNAFRGYFPNIPPTVKYILASDNNFSGEMPLSLCNSRNLLFLDLSNNRLSGSVPRCLSGSLALLNLHHNNLSNLPDTFSNSSLKMLDVSHNQISGKFPRSLVNCKSLEFVNVESNCFSDTFPFWLESLPNLQVLILRANRFYGPISSPHYPLTFSKLMIVDISRNMFDGSLPPNYFMNWSAAISLAYDRPRLKFIGDSYSLGFHPSLSINNKGINMMLDRIVNVFAIVDFSGNKFEGEIPESIGLLKWLIILDLSNNGFTGHIPSSLANLTDLESLDISSNQISGTIPQELGKLSFLSYINMSHNKLTGQIPQGTQFQKQNESSFEGNVDLCGFFLQKSCLKNVSATTHTQHQNESAFKGNVDLCGFKENASATTQASHASKTMHTLNSSNPMLLFSILIVFHFVLLFSIPLSTSL
ncbi:unnamed protein product [Brassica oleracea]